METGKKRSPRTKKITLPVLPLRGLCVFPYMVLHFDVGRKKSVAALEQAMVGDQQIFLVAQLDTQKDDPGFADLYEYGTVSKVKQLLKLPGGNIRVLVEGLYRGRLMKLTDEAAFAMGEVRQYPNIKAEITPELEAMTRSAKEIFDEYLQIMTKTPKETVISVMNMKNPGEIADLIAANVFVNLEDKMSILEETDIEERVGKLIVIMHREMEIVRLERDISEKVKEQIDKNQREYYLREQVKVIQTELGEKDASAMEVAAFRKRLEKLKLSGETEKKLALDIDRLAKLPAGMADSALLKTYLDTVFALPWNKRSKDVFDIERAKKILDNEHYGLTEVKERILEFLAVKRLARSMKGPILCLVGPPGVGKTSVAKSIAKALGKRYSRMSLGGVRDEADIRGHRKTYIGAMPGRIISALRQAKSTNAMILLDEIDKMSSDFRGDPSSAMLEVLDGEQNAAFVDHYIEVPFDLSNIMFVTTANSLESIPGPLLDRMEVIRISGYTVLEKLEIAKRYLIPKQRRLHGMSAKQLSFEDGAVSGIISGYTREAGVRNLERSIATVCRKSALRLVEGTEKKISVTPAKLSALLGKRRFSFDVVKKSNEIGIANGLAWTQFGGDTLQIEVNVMDGKGEIVLTGHLGDVMKESAKAAISYIRSVAAVLGVPSDFYRTKDIHIHVPDGATPKDGPSAGITIATALISALTGRAVVRDVAMTGEITLRGRVLPIGGLKEKALAAYRAGMKTVLFPGENEIDLEEIPEEVRAGLRLVPVINMEQVMEYALACGQGLDGFSMMDSLDASIRTEGTGMSQ